MSRPEVWNEMDKGRRRGYEDGDRGVGMGGVSKIDEGVKKTCCEDADKST